MGFLHLLWTFIFIVQAANCALLTQPEQIHLAFGDNVSDISVTWTTFDKTPETYVEYGIEGTDMKQLGSHTLFVDGGKEKRKIYIHRVLLTNLKPSTKYLYHCGSSAGISPQFWFRTVPAGDNWSPSVVIFGDMGNENAQSLEALQREGQTGMYDAAIHVGDFAYDMDSDNARIGDEFMNQIESFAGYLPYMVCPGNHEEAYNFSNYRNRFSMPMEGHNSMYYSFNLGPVHFISLSTEFYYFINYGIKPLVLQYDWLVEDLKEANKFENRQKQPWIVVFGHRPMYCSNLNGDDCTKYETLSRIGLPFTHAFGLEELLYKYGVDLQIWAHEHSYERLWPIYDYTVYNGSYDHPYTNPQAPVHIITGSAGCKEGREPFTITPPPWSAYHSQDYGYTRMKAMNGSHLYLEQVSDDKKGKVIDSFWIIKDSHGKYPERQHKGTKNRPKIPF